MITKIEVDGFKSLSEFELKLKSGLNILVGPNGAGKTNIIQFFEFLSKIANNPIGHAVTSVGGAGSIFKKIGSGEYQDTIKFKIYGSSNLKENDFIVYEYSCIIKSSFAKDDVYFDHQEIKIKKSTEFLSSPGESKKSDKWDFHMEYQNQLQVGPLISIHKINRRKFKPQFFFNVNEDQRKFEKEVKDYIISNDPLSRILVGNLYPLIEPSFAIIGNMIGGESFNVVPSKVKEQEDAATPPGIKKDGSGLATTLYAIKKSKPLSNFKVKYQFFINRQEKHYDPKSLKKIISYLKLANKTIFDLDVENDPFDNRLIVKIFIKTGSYDAVLPLSSMSDGTIKWLTLITAILTSKTIFSIEEPENFLHPWMQAEIVNIMREHIEEKNNHSFVIMTTHSESLLNHSRPEEVILVDLLEGKTSARRISNIKLLKEEISQSGFGLGHFYFSDSFEA